jgi:STAM-binding protein
MEIINDFLQIAKLNTEIKIETCAVLAGREEEGYFLISHLIVPRQEGAQDHCYMTDEIQMFEAQIQHNVITLGWIHTHP